MFDRHASDLSIYGCHAMPSFSRQEIEEQFTQRLCVATGMTGNQASTTLVTGKHKFGVVETNPLATSMSGAPRKSPSC